MKLADLHLHTYFSDGTYSPADLIFESIKVGLSCIAVVDHDSVKGIGLTLKAARDKNIEVLPGVELTCEYNSLEVHILGYLIDYKNKDLQKTLESLKNNRIQRIYKIVAKLNSLGIGLKTETVFDIAKDGTVGRLHVARAMVREGFVSSPAEAFHKYIGEKCPAYVAGFRLTPPEAIKLIKDVGGIPVLAHPYSLGCNELLPTFVDYGIMGLEVYYPEHTKSMVDNYLNFTKKFNLLVTGGSDCHGLAKPEVKIGSISIPYNLVEELKQAKGRLE